MINDIATEITMLRTEIYKCVPGCVFVCVGVHVFVQYKQ